MIYVGQAMWDDIKILGHLVCRFVCMSLSVYMWWDDIKNLTVSHIKNTACI